MACNFDPRRISVSPLSSLFGEGFPCQCKDKGEILTSQQPKLKVDAKASCFRMASCSYLSGRLCTVNLNIFTWHPASLEPPFWRPLPKNKCLPESFHCLDWELSSWKGSLMICRRDMVTTVLYSLRRIRIYIDAVHMCILYIYIQYIQLYKHTYSYVPQVTFKWEIQM